MTPHHSKIRNFSCLPYTFRVYFTLRQSLFSLFESTLHSLDPNFCSASGIFACKYFKECCILSRIHSRARVDARDAVACFGRTCVLLYLLVTERFVVAKSLRPERMIPFLKRKSAQILTNHLLILSFVSFLQPIIEHVRPCFDGNHSKVGALVCVFEIRNDRSWVGDPMDAN